MNAHSCLAQLYESHRCRVHAVTQPRGSGAVIEDVAQMRIAQSAGNGRANLHQASIDSIHNILLRDGLPEARPARARIELGCRIEQSQIAADATEDAAVMQVPTVAGKGQFRVGMASDGI